VVTALLSRAQAAQLCGVSLDTFERHVQRHLPAIRIGRQLRYDPRDIEQWLEQNKRGPSDREARRRSSMSASGSTALASKSPPEREILARLRRSPRRSTLDTSPTNRGEPSARRDSHSTSS